MDHKSQNSRILAVLESGHSITPLQAFEWFKCLRLSGRVKELREAGYPIVTDMITDEVSKKRYARYRLAEKS